MIDEPDSLDLSGGVVTAATIAELSDLGVRPDANASAAAAIQLARLLDAAVDAKDAASAARELRQAMHTVRGMAPPKSKGDKIDELESRRSRRTA
ncbi:MULTISPECIES: hypothetical protein [unclassified Streptomyces]|uniref:hypothetical protein n=1 Tax=unclassified Streptomyces TaxID=2593676 RepID=UPI0035DAC95B